MDKTFIYNIYADIINSYIYKYLKIYTVNYIKKNVSNIEDREYLYNNIDKIIYFEKIAKKNTTITNNIDDRYYEYNIIEDEFNIIKDNYIKLKKIVLNHPVISNKPITVLYDKINKFIYNINNYEIIGRIIDDNIYWYTLNIV